VRDVLKPHVSSIIYNVTTLGSSTPLDEINGRFALRIKKQSIKKAVEKRMNIMADCHMISK
jgi:hypothetical protein